MSARGTIHGYSAPEFRPVERLLAGQLRGSEGGAALCVYLDGQPVLDLWGGARDESGAAWQRDTLCVAYSTTKGVVATALHILADRGLIDYDAPVAHYWPEFAQAGKDAITVRSVLCHRAGLFDIRSMLESADQMLDWQCMIDALAAAPAQPPPGSSTAYQALTWGHLVGELMRRVSGREVPEIVATEIAEPLGLDGMFAGGAEADVSRAARLIDSPARRRARENRPATRRENRVRWARRTGRKYLRKYLWKAAESGLRTVGHPIDLQRALAALGPSGISRLDFSSDDVLRACIPSANGMFTARALARMYAALAGGGALDGTRLLSPETLARATEVQTRGFDQIVIWQMRWQLGYHRIFTFRGLVPGAFGHYGWGGSGAWADPRRKLALGYVVNTGAGTPVGDMRITRLSSAAVACADRYRRR